MNNANHPPQQHTQTEDEQDFDEFALEQDPVDIEAANWVIRHQRGLSTTENEAWQRWLARDPRHSEVFEDMTDTFGQIRRLPQAEVTQLRSKLVSDNNIFMASTCKTHLNRHISRQQPSFWQRWWPQAIPQFSVAILLIAALGGGAYHWWQQPVFVKHYTTARGQQMQLQLPDAEGSGSRLQLDTQTRITVQLYRNRREVQIEEGQVQFTVAPDNRRPFTVDAGHTRVTVVGTRFTIRHTDSGLYADQTVIAVEEGKVRVGRLPQESNSKQSDSFFLTAGQHIIANTQGELGQVKSQTTSDLQPWRNGRISFNQTPLAEAIAEFERYGHVRLKISDPVIANLPVGGSYTPNQWQHFAKSLPSVLPVRVEQRGTIIEIAAD